MRILLIAGLCLCMLTSSYIVRAQNGPTGPVAPFSPNTQMHHDAVKALVILKTDTGDVRTNNIFVMATDIETMDMPPKGIAQKTMGPITEDVIVVIAVKKNVQLLRLPALLAKYKIDTKYQKLPVYVDGKLVTHPGPVIVAESMVKSVALKNFQIHITTNTAEKGTLGLN